MNAIPYIIASIIGIAVISAMFQLLTMDNPIERIETFEECAEAGHAVTRSAPRQCRTTDGRLFIEEVERSAQEPSENGSGNSGAAQGECVPAGCSGQVCAEASEADEIITDCAFLPEYACYGDAACERQADGQCGWTQTEELEACLANPPEIE